jgi:uncharacterized protein YbjT (DUF2867 family)
MARILVLAATGRVGAALVADLVSRGHAVIAVTRREEAATGLRRSGATPLLADIRDADRIAEQARAVDGVFLASADARDQAEAETAVIASIRRLCRPHVVKLSAQSAGLAPPASFGIQHRTVEKVLEGSGLDYTILRPVFFMQSLALFAGDVAAKSRMIAPAGEGRIAMVDTRDIAEAASAVFCDTTHFNKTYTLTGRAAFGFADTAALLTDMLGRKIRYVSPPTVAARLVLPLMTGMPRWQSNLVIDLMSAIKRGAQESVSTDIHLILDRDPRTLKAYLYENAALFQGRQD